MAASVRAGTRTDAACLGVRRGKQGRSVRVAFIIKVFETLDSGKIINEITMCIICLFCLFVFAYFFVLQLLNYSRHAFIPCSAGKSYKKRSYSVDFAATLSESYRWTPAIEMSSCSFFFQVFCATTQWT